jgi:putative aldouronate transport system permease protein
VKATNAFYKASVGSRIFDVCNVLFMILISLAFLYPLLIILSLSISDGEVLGGAAPKIIPAGFSLVAFREVLANSSILRHYLNTIYYATTGTITLLTFTSMMAYALMYPSFSGNTAITILLLITMFFSGGLIPYYLVVRKLGLVDTVWAMILPNAVAAWNVAIFRTFFRSIPISMAESAFMDGASHFKVLLRIIIPLSKPLLATFTLFTMVYFWNDWFQAVLFLWDSKMRPIQLLLRQIVIEQYPDVHGAMIQERPEVAAKMLPRTMRSATVIITIAPILCIYPFLQKYFAKGIMIGSIKG